MSQQQVHSKTGNGSFGEERRMRERDQQSGRRFAFDRAPIFKKGA
jgi:hypothetical protein